MYLMVAVLTIFTSNDIVILTFTPFICYFCKNAKISNSQLYKQAGNSITVPVLEAIFRNLFNI
jgi:site-specific DNA-cytosine methylase